MRIPRNRPNCRAQKGPPSRRRGPQHSGLLASIADAPLADGLRINLALATADDDVVRALIETELHSHITVLNVWNGSISQQALQKLIDFSGFPLLESAGLTLNADRVSDSMKQELERKFGPSSVHIVPRHLKPGPA